MKNGYIRVTISPDDPFVAMADRSLRVYEHRLVMARHLGRCLSNEELVHHLNADKHDNGLPNLRLVSRSEHSRDHHDEVRRLRAEARRLRAELREALSR